MKYFVMKSFSTLVKYKSNGANQQKFRLIKLKNTTMRPHKGSTFCCFL